MARVKRGVHSKKSHKAVMNRAKGFRGARSRRFKVAKEAVMHAERYAYRDRRARKGDFRRLWITRINAAARMDGLSYSRFMHGLKLAEVDVDRKILADLAVREPAGFSALVGVAKDALGEVDTTSGGPTTADEPTRSSADVAGGVAGTSSVDAVESDEIVDEARAPVEADGDEAEVADATDEVEVEENVLVETEEHDEVDLTDDESAASADESDDAADEADDGAVNADDESPFGEGSAKADDDGAGPEGWSIKGNADSMLYHTEESPYYGRTKAEVWFETETAAAEARFERWDHTAPADDADVEVSEEDADAEEE